MESTVLSPYTFDPDVPGCLDSIALPSLETLKYDKTWNRAGESAPRPANSWVLYRIWMSSAGIGADAMTKAWKNSPKIKKHFEKLANEVRELHLNQYPDYQYSPKPRERHTKEALDQSHHHHTPVTGTVTRNGIPAELQFVFASPITNHNTTLVPGANDNRQAQFEFGRSDSEQAQPRAPRRVVRRLHPAPIHSHSSSLGHNRKPPALSQEVVSPQIRFADSLIPHSHESIKVEPQEDPVYNPFESRWLVFKGPNISLPMFPGHSAITGLTL